MNWKLIFLLSAFGLIMAFATVSFISEKFEPVYWVVIFVFCAYVIAKVCSGRYFLHGLLVSLVNCIWITAAHIAFYSTYMAHHPSFQKFTDEHPFFPGHPRLEMLITGPGFGIIFGVVLGIFAFIASKIVTKKIAVQ